MKLFSTLVAAMLLGVIAPSYGQVAYEEDFEGVTVPALPADWQNKTAGAGGWKTNSGQVNLVNANWFIPAHTKFAVVDDYNNSTHINNPSRLVTPIIDVSALTTPVIGFQYYFSSAVLTGSGIGEEFTLEASVDSGKTWTSLKKISASGAARWMGDTVSLTDYVGEDSLMIAFTFTDKASRLVGAAVDDIEVFEYDTKHDAALQAITPDPKLGLLVNSGIAGNTITIGGTIYNNGAFPITSINVHYQVGSNPIVTSNITGINIKGFESGEFTTSTPFTFPSTVGESPCKIWLELASDVNATNDSGNTTFYTVMFKPQKRLLAEEATGTWCGWCPRGHVFMDSIAASSTHKGSFSLVAVHNSDPMVVPAYDAKVSALVGNSYPSLMIDRRLDVDPSALFQVYDLEKDYFGFVDITLTEVAASGFNYSLKASVKPGYELGGDYRLAIALTEDDVRGGPDGSAWDQVNYYSFQTANSPLVGSGLNWQQEPAKVPASKMHYNHVARGIFPNVDGAAGSLPAMMIPGTTYDYTFNIPMQPWWHRENMHAVVMLIRNSDGHVLNSNNLNVSVGVSDVAAGVNELTVAPNPTVNNAYINFSLTTASNVDVVITDMMGRTVQTINKENFGAGAHKLNVDLSGVTSGVYNVTVKTDSGSVSTRLSVVK